MKSIADTLTLVESIVDNLRQTIEIEIALVGGYAVIAHGAGRTTLDVDFLIYSSSFRENAATFKDTVKAALPGHFESKWVKGSNMFEDPFPYDIMFLTDRSGNYPDLDFIIPRYKWELEGIRKAAALRDLSFPVLPKPYLIAMKLRAGGPKDHADILELYSFLSAGEKEETLKLAVSIKRDKNLIRLLEPRDVDFKEPEDENLLI